MKIISREQARKCSLKRYFTGWKCTAGHVAECYTSNMECVECVADHPVITREQAIAADAWKYFTGQPCGNGHLAPRKTVSGQCDICAADRRASRYFRLKAEQPPRPARKHCDRGVAELRASVKGEEELTALVLSEARKLTAIRREQTGIAWHIDHMIPLLAEKVSGLHIWSNFQVIPAAMNRSKKNSLVLTQPGEWLRC